MSHSGDFSEACFSPCASRLRHERPRGVPEEHGGRELQTTLAAPWWQRSPCLLSAGPCCRARSILVSLGSPAAKSEFVSSGAARQLLEMGPLVQSIASRTVCVCVSESQNSAVAEAMRFTPPRPRMSTSQAGLLPLQGSGAAAHFVQAPGCRAAWSSSPW